MKVLFDQGTPVPLRRSLPNHDIITAYERGWQALQNGELLSAAETEGFAAIVSTDKTLRYQQKLGGRRLSIVVLMATQRGRQIISVRHHAGSAADLAPAKPRSQGIMRQRGVVPSAERSSMSDRGRRVSRQSHDRLITDALAIEAQDARDAGALGYTARALVQATLRHSRPEGHEFERRNGAFNLVMLAPSKVGLPYGVIPRLMLPG